MHLTFHREIKKVFDHWIKYFAQAYGLSSYVLPRGAPRLRQLHIPINSYYCYISFFWILQQHYSR